jgi:hypothetical protein
MSDHIELLRQLEDTSVRRCWLLLKGLECLPLDRAIELARAAEAFVTGSPQESQSVGAAPAEEAPAALSPTRDKRSRGAPPSSAPERSAPPRHTTLSLSSDRREQLLDRLAAGAKNMELAAEFGLSAQQVQGIRIGSSRTIAKRLEALKQPEPQDKNQRLAKTVDQTYNNLQQKDEIVRYLQQQDDVVVRQADGFFLVNGRFRMSLADIAERANRMRRRQGKPEFQVDKTHEREPQKHSSAGGNAHRVFDAAAEGPATSLLK